MPEGAFDHELEGIPKARKGPPRWMFFMGCGCLLPGFLIVAGIAYAMQLFGGLINKDEAWKSLAEIQPYEEIARGTPTGVDDDPNTPVDESRTPGEFELLLGGAIPFSGGVEAYWFGRDVPGPADKDRTYGPNPFSVTILKIKSDQADDAASSSPGTPSHENMTIEIQGHELRGRRIPEMVSDEMYLKISGLEEVRGAGAVVWLRERFEDPRHEGDLFDVLVFFQRPGSSQPIRDEEIGAFLGPFRVGDSPQTEEAGESPEPSTEEGDDEDSDG